MCSIASESTNDATVGWLINHLGPYGLNALHNGQVPEYSTYLDKTDLIIENIMMNDDRNDTEHRCILKLLVQNTTIRGDPILLIVAGEHYFMHNDTFTISCY